MMGGRVMAITYEIVAENLNNLETNTALENEYMEILKWDPIDIALDLIAYAEDCEDTKPEELVPHIKQWLEKRKM
jgi:hypothetical protein